MELLRQLLFENTSSETINEAVSMIQQDCQKIISEIDAPLYRGMRIPDNKSIIMKKAVRMNRRALDTKQNLSDIVDEILEPIAGFKPRSQAVFCTGDRHITTTYGDPYIIFPIGDYKFIYSPVILDFYTDVFLATSRRVRDTVFNALSTVILKKYNLKRLIDFPAFKKLGEEIEERDPYLLFEALKNEDVKDVLTHLINSNPHWYKTDDLVGGIESGKEIMFHCKEYYAVSVKLLKQHGISPTQFMKMVKG